MKVFLLSLAALFLCTLSGFAVPNNVAYTGRTYDFRTVDRTDITAKVLGHVNENWIQIQYTTAPYATVLLNLRNVITVQEVVNGKKQ